MGEIGEIISGGTPSTSNDNYWNGNISWITPADLSNYKEKYISRGKRNISIEGLENSSAKIICKGSVLFSSRAPIGYVVISEKEVTTNQGFKSISPYIENSEHYIYYFLLAEKENISLKASGTTFKELSGTEFAKIFIPLPPLSEQRRIVEKIEELLALVDDLETNKTNLQSYIKEAKSKVLEMAVRGELVPQNPEDEPASVLLERIKKEQKTSKSKSKTTEHNTHYEEELPFDIPENWVWCRLGEVCEKIETGNSINAKIKETKYKNLEEGFPYIGTKDISENHYIKYDNGIKIPFLEKFKIAKKNSVLLCIEGGSAGRKIGITNRDVCFGNKLAKFYSHNISNSYILFFLMSEQFKSQFKESVSGLIGGVSVNKLGQFVLPLPPLAEQKRIVEKIGEIFSALEFIEEMLI